MKETEVKGNRREKGPETKGTTVQGLMSGGSSDRNKSVYNKSLSSVDCHVAAAAEAQALVKMESR
jgi:hypothetical protein